MKYFIKIPISIYLMIFAGKTQVVYVFFVPQASFHERVRAYSNWQHAQQMLTKKREALVKLELASKNEKLPQAQEEVKEVRIES